MTKTVELSYSAYRWLLRHDFMTEDDILSVIKDFPIAVREYIDMDHFKLSFNKKKNRKFVRVTIWVQETSTRYLVYKIHSIRI